MSAQDTVHAPYIKFFKQKYVQDDLLSSDIISVAPDLGGVMLAMALVMQY